MRLTKRIVVVVDAVGDAAVGRGSFEAFAGGGG